MTSEVPELHDDPYSRAMEAGDILEIEGSCIRFGQKNTDLQDALENAHVEMDELSGEIASLQEKNRSLQKMTSQLPDLKKEVENLRLQVKQNKYAEDIEEQLKKDQEQRCMQMEQRCLQMEQRTGWLLNQLGQSEDENFVLYKEVTRLRHLISDLEKQLQKKGLELEKKDELAQEREFLIKRMNITLNEYLSTITVLRNRINTLQSQLEEYSEEIALRKTMDELSGTLEHPVNDGSLMYEILKVKLDEERLRWTEQQKKWGFLGLRFLYNIMLKVLWCNIKVAFFSAFFLLFFHYVLQIVQMQKLRFLGSCSQNETIDLIEHILEPYIQGMVSDMMPT